MRAFGLMVALSIMTGCYSYHPTPESLPRPGVRVAAELSDSGTLALARSIGPSAAAVNGRVLRATETEIELSVTSVLMHNGDESYWRGERLAVSRDLLRGVRERRFSKTRSVLFAVGLIGGAIALQQAFGGDTGGAPPIDGGGGTVPR